MAIKQKSWQEILKEAKEGKRKTSVGGVMGLYAEFQSFSMEKLSPHGISFYLKYMNKEGKTRTMALPKGISLSEARTNALEIRKLLNQGIDPLEKRKQDAEEAIKLKKQEEEEKLSAQYTFRKAGEDFISTNPWRWKQKGKAQRKMREMAEKYIYPVLGDIPLKSITTAMVANLLDQVNQHSPSTGSKVKTFIKHTYVVARRTEKVKDLKSPFGPELDELLSDRKPSLAAKNMGALPHNQIPSFIKALLSDTSAPSNSRWAIVVSILTAARSQAVRYMTRDQIDFDKRIWRIPPENDKIKSAYRNREIFLSPQVCEILKRIPKIEGCDYFFPSSASFGPLGDCAFSQTIRKLHNAKKAIDGIGWVDPTVKDRMGNPRMVTQHGCSRAGFKTWAIDDENGNFKKYPAAASEYCLLHTSKDPYNGAYDRAKFKKSCRDLMDDWGAYCFQGINLDDYLPPLD